MLAQVGLEVRAEGGCPTLVPQDRPLLGMPGKQVQAPQKVGVVKAEHLLGHLSPLTSSYTEVTC